MIELDNERERKEAQMWKSSIAMRTFMESLWKLHNDEKSTVSNYFEKKLQY